MSPAADALLSEPAEVAVVGAGPAGLMAAEMLVGHGLAVAVYDAMPSVGRKFLMAGRGGLNLTHSEPFDRFVARYGAAAPHLMPMLEAFPPEALRHWARDLGIETFVGSSGRVFPSALKASPLLRAWLARLGRSGVRFQVRRRWTGFGAAGALRLRDTTTGQDHLVPTPATVLALGGASWARLGSDGAWTAALGLPLTPFRAANCGFLVAWPPEFVARHAGTPLKNIALRLGDTRVRGEAVVAGYGIEGGAVYALGAAPHQALAAGEATLLLDLKPDLTLDALTARLGRPRRSDSLSNFLRKAANLPPIAAALLRAVQPAIGTGTPHQLAAALKALPLRLTGTAPIDRAISTAGGVQWPALDRGLQVRAHPGLFLAGEMLDWEAPTGGYLLQACMASGRWAGKAAAGYVLREELNGL